MTYNYNAFPFDCEAGAEAWEASQAAEAEIAAEREAEADFLEEVAADYAADFDRVADNLFAEVENVPF